MAGAREYLFYVQDPTGREIVHKTIKVNKVGEVVAEFGAADTIHLIHKGDSVASGTAPLDVEVFGFHRVSASNKLAKPVSKVLRRPEE